MADHTLTIGAPSLRGEDAREGLNKVLAGLRFPLKVQATNQFPFKASFPAAGRLFLQPSGHSGHRGEVTFTDSATLVRFVGDVQAVAELRKAEVGIVLEWAAPTKAPTRASSTASSSSSSSSSKSSSKTDA